jgi:hypothetical protein
MATRKAKRKTKPARKAARKPAKRAAVKKAAPKRAAPKVAAPKGPPQWTAAQKREFNAIQERAKALSPVLKRTDFDADGNPLPGPWASMLADLRAWARRHKVTLEAHEHDHAPAAGAAAGAPAGGATPFAYGGDCPGGFTKVERKKVYGTTYIHTYTCTLSRQTWLGRCVYDCSLEYTLA